MIPNVCANCGVGGNVGNGEQLFGHVCDAMPFALWIDNPLDHRCGGFRMSDTPVYVLPDERPVQDAAPEAGEPAEADGPEG